MLKVFVVSYNSVVTDSSYFLLGLCKNFPKLCNMDDLQKELDMDNRDPNDLNKHVQVKLTV